MSRSSRQDDARLLLISMLTSPSQLRDHMLYRFCFGGRRDCEYESLRDIKPSDISLRLVAQQHPASSRF
ncbi:hypothetical protein BELL_0712g00080 [Botrytis elliptica]|uniref:Uncharacterized protein n=1 Tax=Botrytis elliptica TaxID=278938 RepID=A0A4Z1JGN2_9HELO|nr:hypothetical protein BELL_0712g00080 [Botrytis elliptica]